MTFTMLKTFQTVAVLLISVIVPNCDGVLIPNLNGRIMASVFPPYDDYGKLKLDVVPKQADFFAKRNIKNIQILGYYGEGPIIALPDRKDYILAWYNETERLRLNLVIEIGVMPFSDQVELAKFCSKLNVAAISAFPVLVYEAQNDEEIIEDYRRLSEAAPNVPLLYRGLSATGPEIQPAQALVALLGKVKTLVGGVISNDNGLDVRAALPSVNGYQFWIYGSRNIAAALTINMNVSVTNSVNLCPKLALAIEAAVDARNFKEAFDLQQKLNRLYQAIFSNKRDIINTISRVYFKYLRATFQIFTGIDLGSRLPFEKATSAELETIRCNLRGFEDFINCYCK